jgi:DNA-binding CsgD family transcriptional regulator
MSGQTYVTPLVAHRFDASLGNPGEPRPIELTDRQREIVQLVAEGRSMKEVGGILAITPRTVAFHKYRIMKQLRLRTTAELIQYAIKRHMV